MPATLDELAGCFAQVIVHYHNIIVRKRQSNPYLIQNPDKFIKQKDCAALLEDLCDKVIDLYGCRQEHLNLCLTLYTELSRFHAGIEDFVRDIIALKLLNKEQDLTATLERFVTDCTKLKIDMITILADLYRLNHLSKESTIKFTLNQKGRIKELLLTGTGSDGITSKMISYGRSLFTGSTLPDFGQSLKTELLVKLALSEIPSYSTPEAIAKDKMNIILISIGDRISDLIKEQWDKCGETEEAVREGARRPSKDDEVALIALISRSDVFTIGRDDGQKGQVKESKEASSWGLSSVLSLRW